jgi:hypothetical protein
METASCPKENKDIEAVIHKLEKKRERDAMIWTSVDNFPDKRSNLWEVGQQPGSRFLSYQD